MILGVALFFFGIALLACRACFVLGFVKGQDAEVTDRERQWKADLDEGFDLECKRGTAIPSHKVPR